MTAQELIARLREWLDATQTMEQKLRCNPDYELPALKDFAALESLLTVKGEPGEAIKILSNYFTPVGNQNRYSVRQYRECITILESTIADLTEKVRVIDEIAASKQENGNLFDRLRMMAQEVTGRDCDIERLEAELAIERERREKAEALLKVAAGTCAFLFWSDIDSCPADHVDPEIWDCEEKDCAKNIDGVVACWIEYFDARREYNLKREANREKGAGNGVR
jgi:hypothetical protein